MIEIYQTRILIHNYTLGEYTYLERLLSVWDKVCFKVSFNAFIYDEDNSILIIPYSDRFLNMLIDKYPNKEIIDKSKIPNSEMNLIKNIKNNYEPRNEIQKRAIDFLIEDNQQKLLSLNTGEGKTFCAIDYICRTKRLPIIFVDSETLLKQWIDKIKFFTNMNDDNIYILSGKDSITKLYNMKRKDSKNIKFVIAIHRTLYNFFINNGYYESKKFFDKINFGVKIFDESHVEFFNMVYMDCMIDCPSIYLTATPMRSNLEENKVYQNIYKEVKAFSNCGSNKIEKYHNIFVIKFNSEPSANDKIKMVNKYGLSLNNYFNYFLKDDKYKLFLNNIKRILNITNKDKIKKTSIVVHNLKFIDVLIKDLKELYPNLLIKRFDSTIKETIQDIEKADIIVTTDKRFNKAIDINNLQVMINTVPVSSKSMNEQLIGRLRKIENDEVYYFDLIDIGFKNCANQLNMKKSVYFKKGKRVSECRF